MPYNDISWHDGARQRSCVAPIDIGLQEIEVVPGASKPCGSEPDWKPKAYDEWDVLEQVFKAMQLSEKSLSQVRDEWVVQSRAEALLHQSQDAAAHALLSKLTELSSVDVVALGSVTNIARAIEIDKDTFSRCVTKIVFVGDTAGGSDKTCFNAALDPKAFSKVLNSGVDICLIGQHVFPHKHPPYSNQTPNPTETGQVWQGCGGRSRAAQLLRKVVLAQWSAIVFDPLAVAFLVDPEMFSMERISISISTQGHLVEKSGSDKHCSRVFEARHMDTTSFRSWVRNDMDVN